MRLCVKKITGMDYTRAMSDTRPIGVFDSGVGGLSVLAEIRKQLPREDLLYVADSAHVPYCARSADEIRDRSLALARFLLEQGAKVLVVACNTATAAAAGTLRETFTTPVVAMEPAVKPAAAATRNGVVGVLATVGTLRSAQFAALLDRFGGGIEVVTQPCPGLPEQVEAGELDTPRTRALVEHYLAPLRARGADTIVLGCTHYPFLRPLIADLAGPEIVLIDTGAAVARQLRRVLEARALLGHDALPGAERFWTSGDPDASAPVFARLWGREVQVRTLPAEHAN